MNRVSEILVSENGGNRDSEQICREFPNLPISYLFQDPPVSASKHGVLLFSELIKTPFAAILCDDDWWSPGHLENSIRALALHPGCVAAFSACLFVRSEADTTGSIYVPASLRLAGGTDAPLDLWHLTPPQVLGAAWLKTPFHYSTMVVRTEALLQATTRFMLTTHPYYNDRLMEVGLALQGDIVFDPVVHAFIRYHGANWHSGKPSQELQTADAEGRDLVFGLAQAQGIDLPAFWRGKLGSIPSDMRNSAVQLFLSSLGTAKISEYGLDALLFPSRVYRMLKICDNRLGYRLKPWMPPVVLDFYKKARERRPSRAK